MKRSKHSLSSTQLTTAFMGLLTPIGLFDVLPGDTVQQATSLLVRCMPLNTPVMHPVHVRVHHWFVPYRILWTNWEDFITGDPLGSNPVFPYVTLNATNSAIGNLSDYMGIAPLSGGNTLNVSALPFRAYWTIFNEWYRDQNYVSLASVSTADGADTTTPVNQPPTYVMWEKDYYTTSRATTQQGANITVPMSGQAPITGIGTSTSFPTAGTTVVDSTGASPTYAHGQFTSAANSVLVQGSAATSGQPTIFAQLGAANSTANIAVNALRQSLAIQRFEEARIRYGARYTEYLRYLGVRSSDARLQRPEYLGGGKQTIQFSEVLQTAPTTSGTPTTGLGTMGGHGIAAARSNRYRRFFEEHGIVMSLLSVVPKTIYASGVPRMWMKTTMTDFWQKELEHIGQQTILNQELQVNQSGGGGQTGIFGYQDRYDEYRRQESTISGLFRTTFNTWHLARIFAGDVTAGGSFVQCNPTTRVFQDTSDPNMAIMVMHSIQARRLVSKIGTSSIF